MGLELTTRQTIVQRCSTCKQPIDYKPDAEATTDVNLCGAEKYVVCPTCNKVVPEELRTPAYKAVWTDENRERIRQQILDDTTSENDASSDNSEQQDGRKTITQEEWLRDRQAFEDRIEK